ncbi:unnamed protein product [Candida verbasci]|uniref:Peroxin-3 n=1 Tax=Candida verbasci TaxID=1227364 RepID=A0A9W4X936_9ASCO|nr:unnamed protein product [Candida verbasci]
MAIFSSLAGFFNRNKKKILITSAFGISVYLLINEFIIKKIRYYQNTLKQEWLFKQQIKQRFIQTQQDCYYTLLALLPVLSKDVIEALPVELITQALRLKKTGTTEVKNNNATTDELTTDNLNLLDNNNNPKSNLSVYLSKSKIELWNLLKIKTLTRTLTLIYSISGLLLITRLQLNILARRSYLESAIQMAGVKQPINNDFIDPHENYIIEQSYLSLSWWVLNKGWINLNQLIETLVIKKFEKINPKTELTILEFENILTDIINELNINNKEYILTNLFPINYPDLLETIINTNPDLIQQLETQQNDSNIMKLINETNSIMLDSNLFFFDLFNNLIFTNLNILINQLVNSMGSNNLSLLMSSGDLKETESKIVEIPNKSFKLASYLAQLSIQNNIMIDNNDQTITEEYPKSNEVDEIENLIQNLNNGGINNEEQDEFKGNIYINTLNELEDLDEFSAGIYSNFE